MSLDLTSRVFPFAPPAPRLRRVRVPATRPRAQAGHAAGRHVHDGECSPAVERQLSEDFQLVLDVRAHDEPHSVRNSRSKTT